jgi:hypothetical protein
MLAPRSGRSKKLLPVSVSQLNENSLNFGCFLSDEWGTAYRSENQPKLIVMYRQVQTRQT